MAYKQRWDALFQMIDANKSGDITIEDAENGVKRFTSALGIKEGTPAYEKALASYRLFYANLIAATDKNKDGVVTKGEFDEAFKSLVAGGKGAIPEWWKESVVLLFEALDKNGNGEINAEELKVVKNVDPRITDADVEQALAWVKTVTGFSVIKLETLMDLVWIWCTAEEHIPALDIIFIFWK